MIHTCYRDVTGKLQWFYSDVQICDRDITKVLQKCYRGDRGSATWYLFSILPVLSHYFPGTFQSSSKYFPNIKKNLPSNFCYFPATFQIINRPGVAKTLLQTPEIMTQFPPPPCVSHDTCHISCVTCQVSIVRCHMSGVTCHL